MECATCDSAEGIRTRIEFLPSEKELEVSLCVDCIRDIAATKSINIVRLENSSA